MKPIRVRVLRTPLEILPCSCTGPPKASMTPSPASMVCKPEIERSRVDHLPDPDGPINAIISPLPTFSDTPSNARRAPKLLEAFRMDRTASDMDGLSFPDRHVQWRRFPRPIPRPGFMTRRPASGLAHPEGRGSRSGGQNAPRITGSMTLFGPAFRRTRCPEKRC